MRPPLCTSSLEHQSATFSRHPSAESVSASSLENARLICSLHREFSVCFAREPIRVRKRSRILLVLVQTCNADASVLPIRSEMRNRRNRGLIAFNASGRIIHNLVTSYPQDIYAQAARVRRYCSEFSFDKNKIKIHDRLKNIKKKMFKKICFRGCSQWISRLSMVMILGLENTN